MPYFQDPDGHAASSPPNRPTFTFPGPRYRELRREPSEESIRTDLCEGLVPESPNDAAPTAEDEAGTSSHDASSCVSDRQELMERLKRGESPIWSPKKLETPGARRTTPLLPPAEIKSSPISPRLDETENLQAGLSIERPLSALHSGNFREERAEPKRDLNSEPDIDRIRAASPPRPWLCTSPPRDFIPFRHDRFHSSSRSDVDFVSRSRAVSLSSSYSSSFAYIPPTSPLVQSQTNDEIEFSPLAESMDIEADFIRNRRRHTFQPYSSTPVTPSSAASDYQLPFQRRDASYAYQAHQPRRSLALNTGMSQPTSSPQTPAFRHSRRPSLASDSPLHHASMVGSYEESILRGRMSTTPSKPLDFVAQIGVLGLGKCKPSLKCPPHVALPFPAVFYSYATTAHVRHTASEDGPSPYVGQIDLENGLPAAPPSENHSTKRTRHSKLRPRVSDGPEPPSPQDQTPELSQQQRRLQKQKRRSTSPRAPPGGCYRIPEKGQLQIIIKNPNKTAVKLFLVPYDLEGMEPGTKTFIRQRSYSAGPIMDIPPTSTSSSTQQQQPEQNERATLRYLIHLHICSPARGRFYLYKSIRVVFANRVPDGKEKLRNELQFPEPRFTSYKPVRDTIPNPSAISPASEKAYRRRSSGFPLTASQRGVVGDFEAMDGIAQTGQGYPYDGEGRSTTPIEPIPFSLYKRSDAAASSDTGTSRSGVPSRPPTQDGIGSTEWGASTSGGGETYDKLCKGDIGYGGNAFVTPLLQGRQVAEGLLALKLRGLGVGRGEGGGG
ncbi:hypothetical protein V501_06221 [Pseudogymnoascus sp. VKM F-4519 (FW-2642)]|nr:hypothetical protein V501_06221 [Pseudogymnoascus sp. VKM F-4519 (FW-2642)]